MTAETEYGPLTWPRSSKVYAPFRGRERAVPLNRIQADKIKANDPM